MKRKNWFQFLVLALCALVIAAGMAACRRTAEAPEEEPENRAPAAPGEVITPEIPESLEKVDGVPVLTVYNVDSNSYESMDIERYVMGVLAGEMRNDWPMEAMKAQAILARTFVLKFIDEKTSQYAGADISTDISEAQAYDAGKINDRVEKAVNETAGQVLSAGGELPYAWFHAHAGGKTELPTAALDYDKENPSYTQVVESPDSDKAPTSVKQWRVSFPAEEVAKAASDSGVSIDRLTSIELGDKGESGRTIHFLINGQEVSAPALRIHLDSQKLKSTLLSSVSLKNGEVTFEGSGYGHGVGMSQWGAYGMAEEGASAEEIIYHYFRDVGVAKAW